MKAKKYIGIATLVLSLIGTMGSVYASEYSDSENVLTSENAVVTEETFNSENIQNLDLKFRTLTEEEVAKDIEELKLNMQDPNFISDMKASGLEIEDLEKLLLTFENKLKDIKSGVVFKLEETVDEFGVSVYRMVTSSNQNYEQRTTNGKEYIPRNELIEVLNGELEKGNITQEYFQKLQSIILGHTKDSQISVRLNKNK